ncbi:MAG TPA: hypothetical protein VF488_03370 [Gemmatimonadaceae bacterium]
MARISPRARVARALMFVPVVAVAACSDAAAPSASSMVSVAFRTAPATSGLSASRMLGDSTPAVPASDITLTKVQLVLSHIELSRIDSACVRADTTDDANDEVERRDDCHEIKLAPMLVDLPITPDAKVELSAPVPPGKYRNLHARITALTASSRQRGAADFVAANPDFAGTSVRIEGTYLGKPFTFISNLRAEIYIPFRPPLDLTDTTKTAAVTVAVDPSRWFKTQNGTTIDPTTVGLDQPNNAYIAANIRRSFRVYRDDDHNGRGDHEHQGQD